MCRSPRLRDLAVAVLLVGCTGTTPSSGMEDGGTSAMSGDSGVCAAISQSDFDTSCATDSDCMEIQTGKVCEDGTGCICGESAISARDQDRYNAEYQAAVSVIRTASALDGSAFRYCGCGTCPVKAARCIANRCVLCGNCPLLPSCPLDGG